MFFLYVYMHAVRFKQYPQRGIRSYVSNPSFSRCHYIPETIEQNGNNCMVTGNDMRIK